MLRFCARIGRFGVWTKCPFRKAFVGDCWRGILLIAAILVTHDHFSLVCVTAAKMAELRYKRVSESGKSRYVRNVRRRAPRAVPAKDTWERATSRLAAGFVIKKRLFAAAHEAAPV